MASCFVLAQPVFVIYCTCVSLPGIGPKPLRFLCWKVKANQASAALGSITFDRLILCVFYTSRVPATPLPFSLRQYPAFSPDLARASHTVHYMGTPSSSNAAPPPPPTPTTTNELVSYALIKCLFLRAPPAVVKRLANCSRAHYHATPRA